MDIEQARFNMVEQTIRPAVILTPQTIETLGLVRRERFVAPARRGLAFADVALPLPGGDAMLTPEVTGRLLQAVAPRRGESVLLIGVGSGYLAALLAAHAEHVHGFEIDAQNAEFARHNLAAAGVANVSVTLGDGLPGCAGEAPFDLIVATGAVEALPAVWLEQLKPGGRLFAFVGRAPLMSARLVRRSPEGGVHSQGLFETRVGALRAPTLAGFTL
ncbi:MAG: protein-L-isoaspartate O-methyltransferase [Candidatus Dactylopiibacterium sp.]|nr:protein-L-isoaspartate O-methyltransferase [Candidatus Dactylopiibacterium sp.]